MRTTTNPVPNAQYSNNQGYAPSVPLSVYRDLAAELQAAQAVVDSLSAKNQHLSQENQLLRQEIAKAINSVMQLQQFLSTTTTNYYPEAYPTASTNRSSSVQQPPQASKSQPRKQRPTVPKKIKINRAPQPEPVPEYFPMSEPVYIEEQEVRYHPYSQTEKAETNGWMLLVAIALIILTAFGAGYLIVRPLLANHSNS
jgi:cobalamin biosynthesis Mg chelatase CobN